MVNCLLIPFDRRLVLSRFVKIKIRSGIRRWFWREDFDVEAPKAVDTKFQRDKKKKKKVRGAADKR